MWTYFQNAVAANKLCRHVGLGCTTYQGSSKSSPGLSLSQRETNRAISFVILIFLFWFSEHV